MGNEDNQIQIKDFGLEPIADIPKQNDFDFNMSAISDNEYFKPDEDFDQPSLKMDLNKD